MTIFLLIILGAAGMTLISFGVFLVGRWLAFKHWQRKQRRAAKVRELKVQEIDCVEYLN